MKIIGMNAFIYYFLSFLNSYVGKFLLFNGLTKIY